MKFVKKLSIFVILSLVLCMTFTTVAFAAEAASESAAAEVETEASGKLPMNLGDDNNPLDISKRVEIALQGTVTGMLMVFAVLGLLAIILTLSKVIFYDIPNKKKEEKKAPAAPAPVAATAPEAPVAPVVNEATDDGELAAVITAAIAAMIESGDYKNEFVGGFRVVSFKRSANGAWNRK